MRYHTLLLGMLIAIFSCTFSTQANAQSRNKIPQWEVRAGVGLLPTFLKDQTRSELQPISLEVRYRANAKFSLGLLAGNSISQVVQEHHTGETRRVRNDFRMAALRGAVHSSPFEKWEVYGGIVLGYTHSNVTYMNVDSEKDFDPTYFPQAPQRNGLMFSA
ncbi:MAG: hypothetical protein AAGJ93_12165, partial [Bacteroidota bacterium]